MVHLQFILIILPVVNEVSSVQNPQSKTTPINWNCHWSVIVNYNKRGLERFPLYNPT